jgi:carboxymethylenebutenolidase
MRSAAVTVVFLFLALPSGGSPQDDPALERLNSSPRHHEWAEIARGDRTVHAFVVYPEVSHRAPVVVVIHENRGLTDWVRSVADRLAEEGYLAIAPDLLSGMAPGGGKSSDFVDRNARRDALYERTQDEVTADLMAVTDWAKTLPAGDGTVSVAGFCWGGRQTFRLATERSDLEAAYVFYGTAPEEEGALEEIACPIYGFYGGNDARVNATIDSTAERMRSAGKTYEPVIYEGARHGFMRAGEAPDADEANRQATGEGWQRWLDLLDSTSGGNE